MLLPSCLHMDPYFCLLPSLLCFVSPPLHFFLFIYFMFGVRTLLHVSWGMQKWASCGRAPGGSGFPHGILQTLSRHQDSKSRNLAPSSTQRLRSPTSGLKKTSFNWHADCYPRGAGCPPPQGPHLGTEWGRCESVPGVDQTKKDC